jgi:ATP-dependent RNA helicase RhlB
MHMYAMKFEELEIPEAVRDGIKAAGFTECTPVQALTLPAALGGKDIAAQAQTGTGKTAAFLIAVFSRMLLSQRPPHPSSPTALVISPTRELAVQIDAEAQILSGSTGFRIVPVFGGIDYQKQRNELARGVDMLIGTPGRLIDFLKQQVYSLKKTEFLVIDEADRMFDMGFIADLRYLLKRMSPYNERQSMMFSATLSYRVLELSHEFMNMPEKFQVTPEKLTVDLIEQQIYHVGKSEKFGLFLGIMRREPGGRYLVFCNMKVTAERLKRMLEANGVAAEAITGDLPQRKRLQTLDDFRDGVFPVMIATDVASRGLHIEGVTHVINYDLPQDREDYVHRIGRTGRAGAGGKAISLACENYVFALPDIESYIKQKIPVMPLTDEMIVDDYVRPAASERRRERRPEGGRRAGKFSGKDKGRGGRRSLAAPKVEPAPQPEPGKPKKKRRRRRKKPGAAGPGTSTQKGSDPQEQG